ncbi:hypothetical protein K439DRAFT_947156 [Ramaria rubella]|nr:hypothetical protein K439DRAFT_947156 [Ramaria rubella]
MLPPTPRLRPVPLPPLPLHPPSWSYPGSLPSPVSPGIQLHDILRPSSPPRLYYDLDRPPSTIIFDGRYTQFTLAMPATTPLVTSFRIILPTSPPLPVVVHNLRGVTVFDVLNILYHSLHAPVSPGPSVWDELDFPQLISQRPLPFRARSYELSHAPRSPVGTVGRRKIEYLHGRTMFAGLELGSRDPDITWDLHTSG